MPVEYGEFEHACFELARVLCRPESDSYVWASLFVFEGTTAPALLADLVFTAYHQDKGTMQST